MIRFHPPSSSIISRVREWTSCAIFQAVAYISEGGRAMSCETVEEWSFVNWGGEEGLNTVS